jgi:glycosyltransferase involved in cell wall biosynthesis
MYKNRHVCAVIPARDEALSIGKVVSELNATGLVDRIIVCDNGSRDATAAIARSCGAELVTEARPGYGAACSRGLAAINQTDIVVFVDADDSLQLNEIPSLLEQIVTGADLVVGVRVPAWRARGSMTAAQIFGNRVASQLVFLFWRQRISDLGPFRALRFDVLQQLQIRDRRCGWTVEMQIRAIQLKLNCREVPVHYRARIGRSKISGNLKGVVIAGIDIISTILRLALNSGEYSLPGKLASTPKR